MNPIIVALDYSSLSSAREVALRLCDHVGGFKVGLELLMGHGPIAIESIAGLGLPVFVDAKLHDIPNTVLRASRQISEAGARWVTVHASGGSEMVAAANDGMNGSGVLAVTVLTSLDTPELAEMGIGGSVGEWVRALVPVAAAAGAEGVVCSPFEASLVKQTHPQLLVFTPGIRMAAEDHHDQVRVNTPRTAVESGADFLVVGRPITTAEDMVAAARALLESASSAA